MPPVTAAAEISGYIAYNAWADDADKGSAGAGDGLTPATAFDTIDAALASFTGITTTDVSVTRTAASTWEIEMVGLLATTNLEDLQTHDDGLTGFLHTTNLTVLQHGTTALNERYRIWLTNPGSGWFRLARLSVTGRRLEERIAQRWIANTILADTVMQVLVNERVYSNRMPAATQAALEPNGLPAALVYHMGNEDTLGIGGERTFASHQIATVVLARQDEPNNRLDYAAQRLNELFEAERNIALTDGTMLSCVRTRQIDGVQRDTMEWFFDTTPHWLMLGIVLEVDVKQAP
jgi:hypothetical protein